MATRTIKHAAFSYHDTVPDPIRPGEYIPTERMALQGDTVEIPMDMDLERGERFGAFLGDGESVPGVPTLDTDEGVSTSQLSDADLVAWIKEDGPTVQEVVDAAEGDPDQAQRLLVAEDRATGGDSRKGVTAGLTAIIANAT